MTRGKQILCRNQGREVGARHGMIQGENRENINRVQGPVHEI